MKVKCKVCKTDMEYPFNECQECGWKPKGKYAKKAKEFARKYAEKHGLDKKKSSKKDKLKKKKRNISLAGDMDKVAMKQGYHPDSLDDDEDEYEDDDVDDMEDLEEFEELDEEEEEEEILNIRCKCGNLIKIKSDKRPLKFVCHECGRKGLLKEELVDEEEYEPPPRRKKNKKNHKKMPPPRKKKHKISHEDEKHLTHRKKKVLGKEKKVRCISCNNLIPASSKYCPKCDANQQEEKESKDTFSSKKPSDVGLDDTEINYDGIFYVGADERKQKDACPICGTKMSFKKKLNSYYCPKCGSFY